MWSLEKVALDEADRAASVPASVSEARTPLVPHEQASNSSFVLVNTLAWRREELVDLPCPSVAHFAAHIDGRAVPCQFVRNFTVTGECRAFVRVTMLALQSVRIKWSRLAEQSSVGFGCAFVCFAYDARTG